MILLFKQDKKIFMTVLTPQEKKAARLLQGDIPLIGKPFAEIAGDCGITSAHLITLLKNLFHEGILRKCGAILRHQKAGYEKNALVMWSVPQDAVEKAGQVFAAQPYISHCYERKPAFQDKYNIFTMLHGKDEEISSLAAKMSALINLNDFLILESLQEFKKTSPEYF